VTLPDLIDLEAQLARDHDASPAALEARDRAIVTEGEPRAPTSSSPPTSTSTSSLLAGWLETLRAREPGALFPGRAVARALGSVRAALALLGLALGWGTAAALVAFTGGHPVDVFAVLLVLVLAQAALLVALAAALLLPAATLGAPLVGLFREAAGALVRRLASAAARGDRGRAAEWTALWHRLRARRSLYHHVEPWLLLGTTQLFGVAFNVGALAALLRAVVFSDVAFGWGTTLVELSPERFQALASALAAPWGWLFPDAVPSLALVEGTRYSRLEGAYLHAGAGRAADPAFVGGWWPFLAAAVACYGLLPRAAALAFARFRADRLLARLPLADAEVVRVVRRLTEPHVETRSPAPEPAGPRARSAGPQARAAPGAAPAGVVLWRDVPGGPALADAVRRHVGRDLAWLRPAGGRDAGGEDPELARAVAGAGAPRRAEPGPGPVVVVAEGFEAPDRAAIRLVRTLRSAAGPERELLVLLVDVDGGRVRGAGDAAVRIWRDGLAPLEDPGLLVEPLAEAP
jgi:hypothetical protein